MKKHTLPDEAAFFGAQLSRLSLNPRSQALYNFEELAKQHNPELKNQTPCFRLPSEYAALEWICDKCVHQSIFETFGTLLMKMSVYAHTRKPDAEAKDFTFDLWQGKPIVFNGQKKKPYMLSVTMPHGEVIHFEMRVNSHNLIMAVKIVNASKELQRTMGYSLQVLRQKREDARAEAMIKASMTQTKPSVEVTSEAPKPPAPEPVFSPVPHHTQTTPFVLGRRVASAPVQSTLKAPPPPLLVQLDESGRPVALHN